MLNLLLSIKRDRFFFLFLACILLLPYSCKKIDLTEQKSTLIIDEENKFFSKHEVQEKEVVKLINALKADKSFNHNLPSFIKKNGIPVWDGTFNTFNTTYYKSSGKPKAGKMGNSNSGSSYSGDQGLFLVPLRLEGQSKINGYLAAKKYGEGKYSYQLYTLQGLSKASTAGNFNKETLKNMYAVIGYFERTLNDNQSIPLENPGFSGKRLLNSDLKIVGQSSGNGQLQWTGDKLSVASRAEASSFCMEHFIVEITYEVWDGNGWYDTWTEEYDIFIPCSSTQDVADNPPGGGTTVTSAGTINTPNWFGNPGAGWPDLDTPGGGYTEPPSSTTGGGSGTGDGGGWDDDDEDGEPTDTDDPGVHPWYSLHPLARYVQGRLVDPGNYPGIVQGYPWLWWEDDNFVENMKLAPAGGKTYDQLNAAEKALVKLYPFDAVLINLNRLDAVAYTITKFGTNGRNNKSDAFRHAFWNALNERMCGNTPQGVSIAKLFADAHETTTPPQLALEMAMDLHNNQIGRDTGRGTNIFTTPYSSLADKIMDKLNAGELRYLSPLLDPTQDPTFFGAINQLGVFDHRLETQGITPATKLTPTNQ